MTSDYPVQPVNFTEVTVNDEFWSPRIETNRRVTIPYDFQKCEETGRIRNFAIAGGLEEGQFQGLHYDDSDVFKVMEGAAYSLSTHYDSQLDSYLDELIRKIGAAQEEDGYLYTIRTANAVNQSAGPERWSRLVSSHELYNVGHSYEAAVAHYQATGKREFLDIAIKNANLIVDTFGPDKRRDIPGHQEIEIGLVKLYRVTGNMAYLNLARFFLDERGHHDQRPLYSAPGIAAYVQDHKPVIEQDEALGHAVRAMYMYTGMADVAAILGVEDYRRALDRLWQNVVSKKLYITGGVGARHEGEAFGDDYELPNASAYAETCAAIGNILWNHRMFLASGQSQYIDGLELSLYNGFLSGVSLSGDTFFYVNPLESDGQYRFNINQAATRSPWFRTSCCPTNVARFMASLPGYMYAVKDTMLYVNLFAGSSVNVAIGGRAVHLEQETRYPWEGTIRIRVNPDTEMKFTLALRVPGWVRNRPVPSELYRYHNPSLEVTYVSVNDEALPAMFQDGYVMIQREWQPGDVVVLELPMPVRRVIAHSSVAANVGRVAVQRGPLVYCAEGVDNGGKALDLRLPDNISLQAQHRPDLLNGVTTISGDGISLIPYYAWSHRGEGEMAVWLRR
jgi:hypothetical protein